MTNNKAALRFGMALVFFAILHSCATMPTEVPPVGSSETPKSMTIPKIIHWQGVDYTLSWTNEVNGLVILEYLSDGETTENWETMITVEISGESAAKAVQAFIDASKPNRIEDVRLMTNDRTGDILVDTLLFDTANDFLEHNLIKFSKQKDGRLIKVFFQTRLRISEATSNKTLVSEKIGKPRLERLDFLSKFQFE